MRCSVSFPRYRRCTPLSVFLFALPTPLPPSCTDRYTILHPHLIVASPNRSSFSLQSLPTIATYPAQNSRSIPSNLFVVDYLSFFPQIFFLPFISTLFFPCLLFPVLPFSARLRIPSSSLAPRVRKTRPTPYRRRGWERCKYLAICFPRVERTKRRSRRSHWLRCDRSRLRPIDHVPRLEVNAFVASTRASRRAGVAKFLRGIYVLLSCNLLFDHVASAISMSLDDNLCFSRQFSSTVSNNYVKFSRNFVRRCTSRLVIARCRPFNASSMQMLFASWIFNPQLE